MMTGEDCENAIEEHRKLNGCNAEHILRVAFGRLLRERDAMLEAGWRFTADKKGKLKRKDLEWIENEARRLLEGQGGKEPTNAKP